MEFLAGLKTVQALASHFAFSHRNFIRRFKDATGNTPIEYIQRVRIEAAKRLLEHSHKSIGEIMLETGYNGNKTFRVLLKNIPATRRVFTEAGTGGFEGITEVTTPAFLSRKPVKNKRRPAVSPG